MTLGVWSEFPIMMDLYMTSPFTGVDTFTTSDDDDVSGLGEIIPLPVLPLAVVPYNIELSLELGIEP